MQKKLNAKNLWKCNLRVPRMATFTYFPKVVLDHGKVARRGVVLVPLDTF